MGQTRGIRRRMAKRPQPERNRYINEIVAAAGLACKYCGATEPAKKLFRIRAREHICADFACQHDSAPVATKEIRLGGGAFAGEYRGRDVVVPESAGETYDPGNGWQCWGVRRPSPGRQVMCARAARNGHKTCLAHAGRKC